jgi:hypothetical protein
MPKNPEIHDIDPKSFQCAVNQNLTIYGYGFTAKVTVELAETRYEQDHLWTLATPQPCDSSNGGTQITVSAMPTRQGGCGTFGTGDLTVTVTNSDRFGKLTPMSFNVDYHD